jgi:beta-aspartyl-peptidase (threonine type)
MTQAIAFGMRVLAVHGTALDAVEAVVRQLEDDPVFNAGNGAVRNEAGGVQMDASIMDGASLAIGAVVGLKTARNPVTVARGLLQDKAVLLAGEGAESFARSYQPVAGRERGIAVGCDTVGCVARDHQGHLAVATSTGGLEGTRVGRVGDVPLPGCGFYADDTRGAVSLSGEGEAIARLVLAMDFLHRLDMAQPDHAAYLTIRQLHRVQGEAGLIAITPDGTACWEHNTPHFTVGLAREGHAPQIFLRKP